MYRVNVKVHFDIYPYCNNPITTGMYRFQSEVVKSVTNTDRKEVAAKSSIKKLLVNLPSGCDKFTNDNGAS